MAIQPPRERAKPENPAAIGAHPVRIAGNVADRLFGRSLIVASSPGRDDPAELLNVFRFELAEYTYTLEGDIRVDSCGAVNAVLIAAGNNTYRIGTCTGGSNQPSIGIIKPTHRTIFHTRSRAEMDFTRKSFSRRAALAARTVVRTAAITICARIMPGSLATGKIVITIFLIPDRPARTFVCSCFPLQQFCEPSARAVCGSERHCQPCRARVLPPSRHRNGR